MKQFIQDLRRMHWSLKLFLVLIILKTVVAMVREQAIF